MVARRVFGLIRIILFLIYDNETKIYAKEYEYNGEKYVRVEVAADYENAWFENGEAVIDGANVWIKVEPITWKIRNWDKLPKELNPQGSGEATVMQVVSEEGIATLPFYPTYEDKNSSLWQNSTIRG